MEIKIATIPLPEANPATNITLVEMNGEVTYNTAPMVEDQLLPLAQPQVKLLLDMTKVPYMSSAGLRMMLSLYRQVTNQEGQIVLVGLVDDIKDTMSITGFLDYFINCDTVEAGIAALKNQPQVLPT
ncbi:anti-sigma factor antagonist [Synechocystis sp. PCC 7509]|uniref:anti-sigma factor antagonist n=1 Tax=Synechocystis sp. PCC 7509 TaxID=927677 RepID=UPI0002AB9E68|nr:anti-sigma factor antagonist [Synechocystis sp. PCC 7509]